MGARQMPRTGELANPTEAEQPWARLLDRVEGIVWEADPRTFDFSFVSKQAERLLGYPTQAWFEPGFWAAHVHPEDRAWVVEACRLATEAGERHDMEYRMVAADGRVVWLRDIVGVAAADGGVPRLSGLMVDVTAQKHAEQALRAREAKLEAAQRMAHLGHWERGLADRRVAWSEEMFRIFGLDPRQPPLSIPQLLALVEPEDRPRVEEALAGDACYELEYRLVRPDGAKVFVHSRGDVERDEAGRPVRLFGTVQDITRRRQAEERLRVIEARFRTVMEHSTDALFLIDGEGAILEVNTQACTSLGYGRDELVGQHPRLFDADLDEGAMASLGARLDARELVTFDTRHRRKDGTLFPVELRVRPFEEDGRRYALALARDVTERKRAERARLEGHALLKAVVEGTSDAIFVKDRDGRYLMINSTGARHHGLAADAIVGKDDDALFEREVAEATRAADRRVMASGAPEVVRELLVLQGGKRTFLTTRAPYRDAEGEVIGTIGIARDVTELERMEAQFRQAQKMEAVGQLAGGVAHDFNNLLTVICGSCDMTLADLPPGDANRELIEDIAQAAGRAASLTRQLLAFSRKQLLESRPIDVNQRLSELHRMVQRLIGEDIEVRLELASDLAWAHLDPGHFEQAILNLAVNARDAMPTGGRLIIETRNDRLTDRAELPPDVNHGPYVLVAVSDTGHGMDDATAGRIFEPFFTTKGPGHGTGLGLAMVYGFVKQSGGHVEVESQPGRGTTFRLYLPRSSSAPAEQPQRQAERPPVAATETILVVEDEPSIRRLVCRALGAKGYSVLEASNGLEGLELANAHPGRIDLLLTDLVLPQMSGWELADRVSKSRPGTRALFISGYSAEVATRLGVAAEGTTLLPKPFTPGELVERVGEVLGRRIGG